MYDIIGDIHGYASKLESLLKLLGYTFEKGSYRHTERTVIFVGDYIDRGPQIPETLNIVRRMVDAGNAIALMGNHEYNAICFHEHHSNGGHLRSHLIKNVIQHYATLKQFKNKQNDYNEYIEWFKQLPLFYENEFFRAVHACWDFDHIKFFRNVLKSDCLNNELIYASSNSGEPVSIIVDETLKGKEIVLPAGHFFEDKEGIKRKEIRIKWWTDPIDQTYKSISVEPLDNLPTQKINPNLLNANAYYPANERPIFFGHYWLHGKPNLFRDNICCVDYSVAKDGFLAAYRWDGEERLEVEKLVWV